LPVKRKGEVGKRLVDRPVGNLTSGLRKIRGGLREGPN